MLYGTATSTPNVRGRIGLQYLMAHVGRPFEPGRSDVLIKAMNGKIQMRSNVGRRI